DLVDRRADALREAVVVERRRPAALADGVVVNERVDVLCGDPRPDHLANGKQRLRSHLRCDAEGFDLAERFDADVAQDPDSSPSAVASFTAFATSGVSGDR